MLPGSVGGLLGSVGGIAYGDPGGGGGGQGEGQEASDHCVSPACGAAVSAVAGAEEVALGLAQRRVARGIGADPGGGLGGSREQAAAVELGRIAGVACPFGGDVVQPGPEDPVGVGLGEPCVAQQRP